MRESGGTRYESNHFRSGGNSNNLSSKSSVATMDDDDLTAGENRQGCRSLVCDPNGIIIAEMVYRCMICDNIFDSIPEVKCHYKQCHIDDNNGNGINDVAPTTNSNNNSVNSTNSNNRSSYPIDYSDGGDEPSIYSMAAINSYNVSSNLKQLHKPSSALSSSFSLSSSHAVGRMRNCPTKRPKLINSIEPQHATQPMPQTMNIDPNISVSFTPGSNKSGFVTCSVCGITKYYAYVQKRFGQFSCGGCVKFFWNFLNRPKKYICPNLGTCPLDHSPRCKACLLHTCLKLYRFDPQKKSVVDAFRPGRSIDDDGEDLEDYNLSDTHQNGENCDSQPEDLVIDSKENVDNSYENESHSGDATNADQKGLRSPEADASGSGNSSPTSGILGKRKLESASAKKIWPCGVCEVCQAEDCGKCVYCMDKPKFGGPGIKKQRCIKKKCPMKGKKEENE